MSIATLLQYVGYGVVFVLMISVLVAAHELGHYLFARMFNMGVEEFAIGFGRRPLLIWMRRSYVLPIRPGDDPEAGQRPAIGVDAASKIASGLEGTATNRDIERIDTPNGPALRESTEFTVRPWPLGGFVRIKGMLPEDDGKETRIVGGFYNKPPWQRFLVLLAGPLFSVLAGIAILVPVYMVDGLPRLSPKPVIGAIGEGPAKTAGLGLGDRIVSIGGQPVSTFYDVVKVVRENGNKTIPLAFEHKGKVVETTITPKLDAAPTDVLGPDLRPTGDQRRQGKMLATSASETVRLGFGDALQEAARTPVEAVSGLLRVFRRPSQFEDNVAGPATMVSATAAAVRSGFWKVLWLSAMLSISVGVFNLLPAPPLDGGQMVMAVAEMLRGGRRLSIRAQAIASGLGLTFVAALILGAFVVDFKRFTGPKEKEVPAATKK